MNLELTRAAREEFDRYLEKLVEPPKSHLRASERFYQAYRHALVNGGKRFRPVIGLFTADLLQSERSAVLPFLAALEMVHCYSLAHDDLPCMDDDDFRRGKPSLHKLYDEATALLVGDALLTDAFQVLANGYQAQPLLAIELVNLLSRSAGREGMVLGQVLDLFASSEEKGQGLEHIHDLKTGKLIRAAIQGSAQVCGSSASDLEVLSQFGKSLGLAFQLADDLLDEGSDEPTSFVKSHGVKMTKDRLVEVTEDCKALLSHFGAHSRGLLEMVSYNLMRAQSPVEVS